MLKRARMGSNVKLSRKFTRLSHKRIINCARKPLSIAIRPLWNLQAQPESEKVIKNIYNIVNELDSDISTFIEIAETCVESSTVDGVRPLLDAARNDLIGGCELARGGYLKQTCTLWRSWFEQIVFAIYFLESPISRNAWQVKEQISINDSPKFKLMLHQILNESGEKHAFSIVYSQRFLDILERMKISEIPKDRRIIKRAEQVLTALSQGVHGTYRPPKLDSKKKAMARFEEDCFPLLREAVLVVSQFWCTYISHLLDFSENILIQLRMGSLTESIAINEGVFDPDTLLLLNKPFNRSFATYGR